MSNFDLSVAKTLAAEGGFFHNKATDEVSNRGITVWFLRDVQILNGTGLASAAEIGFVRNLTRDETVDLYQKYFWDEGHFVLLEAQLLADKAFDLGVNESVEVSVELLQQALNAVVPGTCIVDKVLGPLTAAACNSADEPALYAAFIAQAETRYREIAANNPLLACNLTGWLNRLHTV